MDELMEHRVVDADDYMENWTTAEESESKNFLRCYITGCSVRQCMMVTEELGKRLVIANKQYASIDEHNIKEQDNMFNIINTLKIDKIEYKNRTNLFSAIFGLYKENRLVFNNVDMVFRKAKNGKYYETPSKNVTAYPIRLKWGIYFKIVEIALELAKETRNEIMIKLKDAREKYNVERNKLDRCILRSADVIGLTTTGAAKMNELLQFIKPEIVIVEEAAEILEAHIVTSLTERLKHLILIGDHLQLQPNVNIFELGTKYKLNVSLFERMINNGVPLCTLKTQHRMRPEISNLIIGSIYKELHDHENVYKYPSVKGIKKSLFFINHNKTEETDLDLHSKSNRHEAEILVWLCEYLLQQGYEHKQITILTTYTGQMFLLKKLLPTNCRGVRITCVDNFQGEENDIILLSLVRSNEDDKVGFVAKDNRICVALSRARHGLYVIGNMDGFAFASKTWKKIHKKLKDGNHIGNELELVCESHGETTFIKNGDDFVPLENGGCHRLCNAILPCNHACPQVCHALDQSHEKYKCRDRCTKTCVLNHQCSGLCSEKCPPCKVLVTKTLPCSHQKDICCHQDANSVKCDKLILKKLPCMFQHEIETECGNDVTSIKCQVPVEKVLFCGHVRMVECSKPAEEVECVFEEEKVLHCRHKLTMKCYQSVDFVKCAVLMEKELPCRHKKDLKCSTSENDSNVWCDVIVDVVVPGCFHVTKLPCSSTASYKCTEKCNKTLTCGHECSLDCHVDKDPNHNQYKCKKQCERSCKSDHPCKFPHECYKKCAPCDISVTINLDCGHNVELECSRNNGQYKCIKKVNKSLPCGHEQLVSCFMTPEMHKCTVQIVECPKKCEFDHPCSFEHACYEDCPSCEQKVEKMLRCGHSAILRCHDDGINHKCNAGVKKKLRCGHIRAVECCANPSSVECKEIVQTTCKMCFMETLIECFKKLNGFCSDCEKSYTEDLESRARAERSNNIRGARRGREGVQSRGYTSFNYRRFESWR